MENESANPLPNDAAVAQDDANTSGNDLLSAAICAAGLDEFFVFPTPDEPDQQPNASSTSSTVLPTVEQSQEARASITPLPGVAASTSTSPDLPASPAPQVSRSDTSTVSTISKPVSNSPGTKLIRIVRPDGKQVLLPLKPLTGATSGPAPIKIVVASKPSTQTAVPSTRPLVASSQSPISAPTPLPRLPPTPQRVPFFQQAPRPSTSSSVTGGTVARPPFVKSRLIPAINPALGYQRSILPAPFLGQKRGRVVHFNSNVTVNDRPPSFSSSPALLRPRTVGQDLRWRYSTDNARPFGTAMAIVPKMAPLGSLRPLMPAIPSTSVERAIPTQDMTLVDDEEDEELGFAETYSDYIPAKLRSGLSHPDQVVETSSLSSVLPPDILYHISIPEEVVDTGQLSALQLEAVIYACQKTESFLPSGERTGYLIGDGPGVGKGRTIAGFIFENYLLGRKRALWFSVSSDLKFDAERDLRDIGAGRIKVHALNKFKYAKISGKENGSVKKGVIFATYSSLIGESQSGKSKYRSRLKQLLQWCGKDFDGVIVLDECHRAKNLVPTGSTKPTKTGQTVLELQKALPKARVLYASATGASETRNMAYMTRLGLWGPGKAFKDFNEFISAVEKRGVGAMEIVAMDMKLRGLYLARQLSFAGVTFRIEEVPLTEDFTRMYDESVKLWLEARKQFRVAAELVSAGRAQRKAMWSQFWAAHQRFFKYLCIAAKVKECVRMARETVKNGKCVVIGLQSTGEARTLDQLEETGGEITDFVSTAKGVFQALIEKHFPSVDENSAGLVSRKETMDDMFGDDFDGDDDFFGDMKPEKGAWKRKLVNEHRERKKRAKLDRNVDEGEEWPTSSSSSSDQEQDDLSETEGSYSNTDSDRSSSSDGGSDEDESQSETDSDDEVEDKFNPFADDVDESDPWESKILVKKAKRKRKKRRSNEVERDEELERQLEQALQETNEEEDAKAEDVKLEKKGEHLASSVSASDFFASTSSYIDSTFKPGRFASELGLDKPQIMKAELLAAVERLGEILPPNTLDQLIDSLGGPEYVAEMTGRKGRIVSKEDGEILYELRNDDYDVPLELMNVAERERFMNGDKHIAIISEAASSGISLQSDRRAKNQRRRVHITLELPWSADKAVQQFGRTHRSNQVSAPEYIFLISELAGEQRFASIVAKRLESLGALTHGDRRATESRDLSQFNLDTKYGRVALELTLKSIVKQAQAIVKPPEGYKGEFFHDMRQYLEGVGVVCRDEANGSSWSIEKDMNLSKFLNRLLGLPVAAQNSLFYYFSETLHEVVDQAKRDCRYDLGILDLGHGGEMVTKLQSHIFYGKVEAGSLKTELYTVMVERGLSWDAAMEIFISHKKTNDGFYICNNAPTVILVCDAAKKRADTGEKLFHVYRPNVGLSAKLEVFEDLKKRFRKVSPEEAEPMWIKHFDASSRMCQHEFWFGRCRNNEARIGLLCDVGRRNRPYHILSGSVLTVWNTVENVLSSLPGRRQSRMQVVRVRTDQGQKIVGILVPPSCKQTLIDKLTEESSRAYAETFG